MSCFLEGLFLESWESRDEVLISDVNSEYTLVDAKSSMSNLAANRSGVICNVCPVDGRGDEASATAPFCLGLVFVGVAGRMHAITCEGRPRPALSGRCCAALCLAGPRALISALSHEEARELDFNAPPLPPALPR